MENICDTEIDNPELLKAVEAEFFKNSPVLTDLSLSGQSVKNGIIILGYRAGPSLQVGNLIHEMAHLVEIDRPRMLKWGWGLKYGKYWEFAGRSGYEPQTNQSVLREMRVWAYQYNMQRHLGISETLEELVSSATYLPAYCYMGKTDELRQKAVVDGVRKYLKKYSLKSFKTEWFARMEYLRKKKSKCTTA